MLAFSLLAGCSQEEPAQYDFSDPFAGLLHLPIDLPGAGADIADPHAIRADGRWWIYATHTKADLEVWSSDDLQDWEYEDVVWEPSEGSWNSEGEAWAPSVHFLSGRFYLYYTAGLRIGVAVSDGPAGPFEEVYSHPLVGGGYGGIGDGVDFSPEDFLNPLNYGEFSIDAAVLETEEGELYLYSTSYAPQSMIVGTRLEDPVTVSSEDPVLLLEPELNTWEGVFVEAPFPVEHNGEFHLQYSGNRFEVAGYALGSSLAGSPLGPFTRQEGNPFWSEQEGEGLWGTGHHSLVDDGEGGLLIFYHSKRIREFGTERQIRFGRCGWTEDGLFEVR
jgi:GH43 family beta-xylosidase